MPTILQPTKSKKSKKYNKMIQKDHAFPNPSGYKIQNLRNVKNIKTYSKTINNQSVS